MADLVGLMAVILSLGTPAYIVKRVMDSKDRRAKLALESGSAASGGDHVKRLEEDNKRLRERVENLESIVVGVDYELNQKIARLVDGASVAGLPSGASGASGALPVARPTGEQRATGEQAAAMAATALAGDSPPPATSK